jgi:hypothetical protein
LNAKYVIALFHRDLGLISLAFDLPQLMLAASTPAGHSGRSLTTTYETIAYHIYCSSGRLWLDDLMRQQERIHDDDYQRVVHGGDHEEVDHKGARHQEVDYDYEEVFNQEEDGRGCVAVCFPFTYSLTIKFSTGRRLI